jgi:uncharacterized protein
MGGWRPAAGTQHGLASDAAASPPRTPPRRGRRRGAPQARTLGIGDIPEALAVCAVDPVAAVLAAARFEVAARAGMAAAGGRAWGFPADGPLAAVCWSGANLVPVVPSTLSGSEVADALAAFAAVARHQGRRSSSIVGERRAALVLWEQLEPFWPAAREVRADQPSLAIERDPDVPPEPAVRLSTLDDIDLVLPACVRMFTEEVGYSPVAHSGSAYALRVRTLVADGRSFVHIGCADDGEPVVLFKAEIGAVAGQVAQVQGVWVDPEFRGRGLSESGMAAVVAATRRDVAPVVSLYVNAYNAPALAAYRHVGFEQVGVFATILF